MSIKEDEFLKSLRATFSEADEHLQVIAAGLLALEKTLLPEEQPNLVETVFRSAHSLKRVRPERRRRLANGHGKGRPGGIEVDERPGRSQHRPGSRNLRRAWDARGSH